MAHANRRLLATALGALLFAFFFGWSFVTAFHEPTPHEVPVGVVAPTVQTHELTAILDARIPGGLSLQTYPTPTAAHEAVAHRAVDGAFIAGAHPVLLVASAGGSATVQFLDQTFSTVASSSGLTLPGTARDWRCSS
jgi:hypothetical protein